MEDLMVTKEMSIREVLSLDPGTARLFMEFGMHCLGCPSSQMETIEQAAMVHGIEPQELVDRLNDVVA